MRPLDRISLLNKKLITKLKVFHDRRDIFASLPYVGWHGLATDCCLHMWLTFLTAAIAPAYYILCLARNESYLVLLLFIMKKSVKLLRYLRKCWKRPCFTMSTNPLSWTTSSFSHDQHSLKVSSKCVHYFLSCPV